MTPRLPLGRRAALGLGAGLASGLGAAALLGRAARAAASSPLPPDMVSAAKSEGKLNIIACPPDWANWGGIIPAFEQASGLSVTSENPNGSSAEELQAIRSLRSQSRAPDVVDVGPSFAAIGKQQKLFSPYKVSTWDSIPADMKDPDGYWTGDYFGVIAFAVNTSVAKTVPQSWDDLKKPEYKGMIALNGSPLGAAAAFSAVYAASLANGGTKDDIAPGVAYFGQLAKLGNLSPAAATPASLISGQTPITINWDYLALGYKKQAEGKAPIEVVVPQNAPPFGAYYCQGISAYAPQPKAARLWEEFLYSDEGQVLFLGGYAHPARFSALVSAGKIPEDVLKTLPPASVYDHVSFVTLAQNSAAQKVVADNWAKEVQL